jgi:uncharacterized membrane protein YfcA
MGNESSSVLCTSLTVGVTGELVVGLLLALTSIAMAVSRSKSPPVSQLARASLTASKGNPISLTSKFVALAIGSTIGLTTSLGGAGGGRVGSSRRMAELGTRRGTRSGRVSAIGVD